MRALPLQLIDFPEIPEWAAAFGQVISLLSGVVGLFIAYQAYRGYRRNDSRPMLFVAAGFALALGVPILSLPFVFVVPSSGQTAVYALQQSSQLVGLLTILYALRMEP